MLNSTLRNGWILYWFWFCGRQWNKEWLFLLVATYIIDKWNIPLYGLHSILIFKCERQSRYPSAACFSDILLTAESNSSQTSSNKRRTAEFQIYIFLFFCSQSMRIKKASRQRNMWVTCFKAVWMQRWWLRSNKSILFASSLIKQSDQFKFYCTNIVTECNDEVLFILSSCYTLFLLYHLFYVWHMTNT